MLSGTKTKAIIGIVALSAAYGAGRWASPTKIVTKTETVEVEKKVSDTKSDLEVNKHKETVTTTNRKPDGTVETTTKVVEDTEAGRKSDTITTDSVAQTSTTTKEVVYASAKVTVSLLGGMSLSGSGIPTPVYGASLSKPVWGPITLGVFGLSDRTFGGSVGLTF